MITFKTKKRSYAIVPAYSKAGRECKLLFLTAAPTKDLEQWAEKLKHLDSPKFYHNPPKWADEEEEKFWNDWVLVWSACCTPGETYYKLYANIHDPDCFLYETWDIEGGYHTRPGRYYIDYFVLSPADEICWKEGTWRDYEKKCDKISDIITSEEIQKAIERKKEELQKKKEIAELVEKIVRQEIGFKLDDIYQDGNRLIFNIKPDNYNETIVIQAYTIAPIRSTISVDKYYFSAWDVQAEEFINDLIETTKEAEKAPADAREELI
jgi:hypothetical protein